MSGRIIREALNLAAKEVGVRETGRNSGPRVDLFLRAAGLPPGNPWCAAFCFFIIDEAAKRLGVTNPVIRTAYCPYVASWAEERGLLHETPKPGDLFLRYGPTRQKERRAHHIGFVVGVDDDDFATIEGNTNLAGSPDGVGVFRRGRKLGPEYRFVRWADAVEAPAEPVLLAVVLNGRPSGVTATVIDGQSWVSVRVFASALGVPVSWDHEAQAVRWGGELLPVQTIVEAGSSRVPLRDLVEVLGGRVTYDGEAKQVLVDVKPRAA